MNVLRMFLAVLMIVRIQSVDLHVPAEMGIFLEKIQDLALVSL